MGVASHQGFIAVFTIVGTIAKHEGGETEREGGVAPLVQKEDPLGMRERNC